MKKTIILIATLLSLIGTVHIAVTFLIYETFSTDALWFSSAGCVLIFLAFLHFILIGAPSKLSFIFGYISNGLSFIFFVLFLSIVTSPNFIFLLVLVVIQTILIILLQLKTHKNKKEKSIS